MRIFILSLLVKTSESFQAGVKLKYFLVYIFSCHLSSSKWLPIAVEPSSMSSVCRWPSLGLLVLTDRFSTYTQEAEPQRKHWATKTPEIIIFPATLCGDNLASYSEKQFTRAPMTDQRSPPCPSHPAVTSLPTASWLMAGSVLHPWFSVCPPSTAHMATVANT